MQRLQFFISLGAILISLMQAPLALAAELIQITTEAPAVAEDAWVVQRFHLDLPKGTPDGSITLKLGDHDGGGCTFPSANDQAQRIDVAAP